MFNPIVDSQLIDKALELMEMVVMPPFHLNPEWLSSHHWAAVPVENSGHFTPREVEWIIQATRSIGCEQCLAVATEPMGNYPCCYEVVLSEEGLKEFNRELASLNFVLIPENLAFAILCTSEDYNLIAGPPDFVIRAVGSSIRIARRMFMEYFADDSDWPPKVRQQFIDVAKHYEQFNG